MTAGGFESGPYPVPTVGELARGYRRVVAPRTYTYVDEVTVGRVKTVVHGAAIEWFLRLNGFGLPVRLTEDETGSVFGSLLGMVSRPSVPGLGLRVVVVVFEVQQLRGRLGELLKHADVYEVGAFRWWERGSSQADPRKWATPARDDGPVGGPDAVASRIVRRLRGEP